MRESEYVPSLVFQCGNYTLFCKKMCQTHFTDLFCRNSCVEWKSQMAYDRLQHCHLAFGGLNPTQKEPLPHCHCVNYFNPVKIQPDIAILKCNDIFCTPKSEGKKHILRLFKLKQFLNDSNKTCINNTAARQQFPN